MKNYSKDYPRPQLIRKKWENLNGIWNFAFDDTNCGEQEQWYIELPKTHEIQVPFAYNTKLSLVEEEGRHDILWYEKEFTVKKGQLNTQIVLVHFEGSDYITKVWVNGIFIGKHQGGYARFTFDITNYITVGRNQIVVKVEDKFDTQIPRGKQRWIAQNFGCWYKETTGIWKTVWLEYVPRTNIQSVKMTPVLSNSSLELEVLVDAQEYTGNYSLEVAVCYKDILVNRVLFPILNKRIMSTISVYSEEVSEWGVKTWEPEHPDLYDVTFRILKKQKVVDEVFSYFGMREIRIKGNMILLNAKPLYQKLVLDQGYWKDSHLTPPGEVALVEDIENILALGYNGVRKHQKVEDERFLYWCDVKGLLVWSEMPSAYVFSDDMLEAFMKEWMEIVKQNYNHPSIITWTPINESWGVPRIETDRKQQAFAQAIYHITKSLDSNRPVIVNDGWEHTVSDIITLHDYEEYGQRLEKRYMDYKDNILRNEVYHNGFKGAFADGYRYQGQPIIISEYGGIAFQNEEEGWGYGNKVKTEEEFLKRFEEITMAIKRIPYICGYCYTQITDVSQEINGLLDMERKEKVNKEYIREINQR